MVASLPSGQQFAVALAFVFGTDHVDGKSLVMMHEGSELRVGIREINLLIFQELEVFHDL